MKSSSLGFIALGTHLCYDSCHVSLLFINMPLLLHDSECHKSQVTHHGASNPDQMASRNTTKCGYGGVSEELHRPTDWSPALSSLPPVISPLWWEVLKLMTL